jgi:hypothetical protein
LTGTKPTLMCKFLALLSSSWKSAVSALLDQIEGLFAVRNLHKILSSDTSIINTGHAEIVVTSRG